MRKTLSSILAVGLSACLISGCGVTNNGDNTASTTAQTAAETSKTETTAAAAKFDDVKAEVSLRLSHQMAEEHSINKTALEFARLVKEKSEGKMEVDVFPSATLGTESENLQALTNGTLDMGIIAAEFYANYVPEAGILCLPYMYDSYDDCYDKLEGDAGALVADLILKETDVKVLDYYTLAFRQVFTVNKEINSVDDMKGLIIRIPDSTTYKTTFTQLGAAPTPVAWGETYTALDTGVVAAVENTPESIMSASIQEVCKYVNETNHLIAPTTFSISNKVFSKLSEDQQKVLLEAAKEAGLYGKGLTSEGSDANFAALEKAGLTVVKTDAASFKNAIDYSAYDATKSEAGAKILAAMGK